MFLQNLLIPTLQDVSNISFTSSVNSQFLAMYVHPAWIILVPKNFPALVFTSSRDALASSRSHLFKLTSSMFAYLSNLESTLLYTIKLIRSFFVRPQIVRTFFGGPWSGKIFGNIKISAKNSREAKQRLSEFSKIDLVKKSEIWDNEDQLSIESVDTYLGIFDEEGWDMIFDEVDKEWVLVEKTDR